MQIIPVTNDFNQQFTTALGDQNVKFRIWYQGIGDGWYMSLEYSTGEKIVSGFRINTGSPIITSALTDFVGNIVCVSTAEKRLEPGKDAPWGETHLLVYLTIEESEDAGYENI